MKNLRKEIEKIVVGAIPNYTEDSDFTSGEATNRIFTLIDRVVRDVIGEEESGIDEVKLMIDYDGGIADYVNDQIERNILRKEQLERWEEMKNKKPHD